MKHPPSTVLIRIANTLADASKFEEEQEPHRHTPDQSQGEEWTPCEGCGFSLKSGGLCPTCLKMASDVLRAAGLKLAKGK